MVDLQVLESRGATQEKLRAKFTAKKLDKKIKELIELNAVRIQEGVDRNMRDARIWHAVDQAYDVSQRQITFTLVDDLLSRGVSGEKVMAALDSWGLTNRLRSMMTPLCDQNGSVRCGTDGKPLMKLDLPTFFHIFVPLVQAYTKMRWAKLFGDRDIFPLYKYEPTSMTLANRLRCEIVTGAVQRSAQNLGYREDERQSILQMLKYGTCINFPAEDYYREKQLFLDGGKEVERVVKEGVRFEIPHIARTFWDFGHRLSTANTDTGVEYAGYWNVVRYRQIRSNPDYWNTENVMFRYGKWVGTYNNIFRELNPCMLKFPCREQTAGTGDNDRLNEAYRYTVANDDDGVIEVPFFHRLVPSEWNLFGYDYPVWMRFIFTGSHTVSHAVPLAYSPLVAYCYDSDFGAARSSSLALELIPFQDHLTNLLTQYLLTVKSNLERLVFWNSDIVDQKNIDAVQNLGEKKYRGTTFIPFSKRELSWEKQSERDAFTTVNLPRGESEEIVMAITQLLGMMERVLGYSAQEVGVPATHEQTAEEVKIISLNTSNRLQLTGSFIDSAIRARKKLLYDALMAYADDEVVGEVGEIDDEKRKELATLGFEIESEEARGAKAGIRGKKGGLHVDSFSSDREGENRIVDAKMAATMIQTFQSIFANRALAEAAGLEQLVDLFNQILVYSGAPKDFRLRVQPNTAQTPEEAQQQQAAQLQAVQGQIAEMAAQITDEKISGFAQELKVKFMEPVGEAIGAIQSDAGKIGEAISNLAQRADGQSQMLAKLFTIIQAATDPNAVSSFPQYPAGGPQAPPDVSAVVGGPPPAPVSVG